MDASNETLFCCWTDPACFVVIVASTLLMLMLQQVDNNNNLDLFDRET
jgi:hypothetical protein